MTIDEVLAQDFRTLPELIRIHAAQRPRHIALREDARSLDYRALDERVDRIAASLQRDGVKPKQAIAMPPSSSIRAVARQRIASAGSVLVNGTGRGSASSPAANTIAAPIVLCASRLAVS